MRKTKKLSFSFGLKPFTLNIFMFTSFSLNMNLKLLFLGSTENGVGRKQTRTIQLKPKAIIFTLSFKSCFAKGYKLNLELSKTRVFLELVSSSWLVSKRRHVFGPKFRKEKFLVQKFVIFL